MRHLDELLSAYLDGEVTSAESTRVTQHLGECRRCQRHYDELYSSRAALRSLPTLELPPALLVDPEAQVVPAHRRPSVWVGAAAAVAATVVAVATIATPPRDPVSLADVSLQLGARASLDVGSSPLKIVMVGKEDTE